MITTVVETVLKRYLGEYLEGIDAQNLSLSIFQGEINLSNVDIKPGATELLNLPFCLVQGTVGLLQVKIHWKALKIFIELDDLNIVVGPKNVEEWKEENERAKLSQARQRALDTTDLQAEIKLGLSAEQQEGYYARMVSRASESIEVNINRVHIRYEDPAMEYFCGALLQSLRIQGTDEHWQAGGTVDPSSKKVHKKLDLEHLAVYWQADADDHHFGRPHKEMCWDNLRHESMAYVLYPVSGSLNLTQNADLNDTKTARYQLAGNLQSLTTQFSFPQYSTFKYFFGFLGQFNEFKQVTQTRIERFYPHRPNCSVVGNAKDWWRYAFKCIKISMYDEGILQEKKLSGWDYAVDQKQITRLKHQRDYARLLTKSKSERLDDEQILDLGDLKQIIELDDLIRWHAICMESILKEQKKAQLQKQAAEPQKQSWYSYMTGADDSQAAQQAITQALNTLDGTDDLTDDAWWNNLSNSSGPYLKLYFEILRVGVEFHIDDLVTDKGRLDNMAFSLQSDKDGKTRATFALGDLVLESDRKNENGVIKKHELVKKADEEALSIPKGVSRSDTAGGDDFMDAEESEERLFLLTLKKINVVT